MKDGIIVLISIILITIFIVVVIIWFNVNSKPYNVSDDTNGFYKYSQLNQLCTDNPHDFKSLLPDFFVTEACDATQKLTCSKAAPTDEYGYCKSLENGNCFSIYDCAPGVTGMECIGGKCTTAGLGILYSYCSPNVPGTTGTTNVTCGPDYSCTNGNCLLIDGKTCTYNSECSSNVCNAITKTCISNYQPGNACIGEYCISGFGCTDGFCQPIVGGNTGPVAPGSTGALCSIPFVGPTGSNFLGCDSGLICNFDAYTNSLNLFGVTGYGFGLCRPEGVSSGFACSVSGNACFAPNVCYNGICQAPLNAGVQDINYCGPNSTGICGDVYSCDSYQCRPELGGLCNTSNGVCLAGVCGENKIGVLTRSISQINSHFGEWKYFNLPAGETPGPTTQISVFQTMSLNMLNNPVTTTKLIYFPEAQTSSSVYFYIGDVNIDEDLVITWTQVNITNTTYPTAAVIGVKFTTGGNITVLFLTTSFITYNGANVYPFSAIVSNTLDFTDPLAIAILYLGYQNVKDWDVDDKYNNIAVAMNVTSGVTEILASDVLDTPPITVFTYTSDAGKEGTFCRSLYNSTNNGPTYNFVTGLTPTGATGVHLLGATGQGLDIPLGETTCLGAGFSTTYSNSLSKMELFYSSDQSFRYVNTIKSATNVYQTVDAGIEGYVPEYVATNANNKTMALGNIDNRLFTLITRCA